MTRAHLVGGSVFLLLAAFLGWQATKLTYYSSLGPGAGFFPIWLCVVLAGLSVSVIVSAMRKADPRLPADFWPGLGGAIRTLAVVGGLVFVVLALKFVGFRLTMALFGLALMLALGCRNWIQIAAIVLLGSIGSYTLFVDYLGLVLPIGRFGL